MDTKLNTTVATTTVYTDGSASKNGSKQASGGIGVWFGNDHELNVSCETKKGLKVLIDDYNFQNFKVTNNISELTAILQALTTLRCVLLKGEKVLIKTDSMYSINCLTVWYKNWEKNNWLNSTKKPVLNKELIEFIIINYIKPFGSQITFFKVKAHSNPPPKDSPRYPDFWGNFMADHLAVNF